MQNNINNKYFLKVQSIIKETEEELEKNNILTDEDEIDEMSTSAGAGAFLTPNAFAKPDAISKDIKKLKVPSTKKMTQQGMTPAINLHKTFKPRNSKEVNANTGPLGEASYNDYKRDEKGVNHKINKSLSEINGKLYELKRMVEHAVKLKTENDKTDISLWNNNKTNINKIQSRLTEISNLIKRLGV